LGTWTAAQETLTSGDAYADGFQKAFRLDCTTANASPAVDSWFALQRKMEGYALQGLKKGTANAKSFTVSFWVKSNLTGNYNFFVKDRDNSRQAIQLYTINVADTWEKKTITFTGDTTGVLDCDANSSLEFWWMLGSGTDYSSGTRPTGWEGGGVWANTGVGNVNLASSTDNDWAITGVQFEIGDTATPFEHKTFGQELAACQRYFCKSFPQGTAPANGNGVVNGAMIGKGVTTDDTEPIMSWQYPVVMRAAPTVVLYNHRSGGTASQWDNHGSVSGANARVIFASDFCVRIDNADMKLAAANAWMIHATASAEL
jgi:hypothetical protein